MRVGFVGLGKLGLPCALAIESKGHQVLGLDVDPRVRRVVESRSYPHREAGIEALLARSKLRLLASMAELADEAELIFVAVQTPHDPRFEGASRLPAERSDFGYGFLRAAAGELADALRQRRAEPRTVLVVSTVLPGTIEREVIPPLSGLARVCYNPSFVAMGTTIADFLAPEFVLLGGADPQAGEVAERLYRTLHGRPIFKTSIKNAELIKVAYNTFIGMKIVFANTLMEICHKLGGDVDHVTRALGMATSRLVSTSYLSGGMGDGGGCHPRDNIAMSWLARELSLSYDLFDSVMRARERQTEWLAELLCSFDLPKVVLGKAFKKGTNLTDGSPALLLCRILEERGEVYLNYDPHVDVAPLELAPRPHAFLVATNHPEFEAFRYPAGSVVIDPWGYISMRQGVRILRVGRSEP
jgi:UDPglucose 6-dehydrogenase